MDQFDRATQLEEQAREIALAQVLARTQGAGASALTGRCRVASVAWIARRWRKA